MNSNSRCFLVVLAIVLLALQAPGKQGLTAFYPLDGDGQDVSGNNHNGTVVGALPVADRYGVPSAAMHFGGNDRIDIADDPGLTLGAGPFTIMAWARMEQFSSDSGYYLLGQSNGPGNIPKWIFFLGNGSLSFIVGPSPGWIGFGAFPFQVGEWYHLAVRSDGSTITGFVNGASIGSGNAALIPDSSNVLQLGTAEGGHPGRVFRGDMDDVRIYHRALTDGELGEFVDPGEAYCFGYGCPCANEDPLAGCATSLGSGVLLTASGSASASADDLVLTGSGAPTNKAGILFMGGAQATPVPFGDGKLCVNPGPATFCRFPVQSSGPTGTFVEGPGMVAYSQGLSAACHMNSGDTWYFQAWFRDPLGLCGAGFNLSNALAVTIAP